MIEKDGMLQVDNTGMYSAFVVIYLHELEVLN